MKTPLSILLLLLAQISLAQEPSFSGFGGVGGALNPIMPDQFRTSLESEEITEVQFYNFSYKGNKLDLRSLNARYGNIPQFVDIVPPEALNAYSDVIVMVGIPEKGQINGESIIIFLAANFDTNDITLFADKDQDRNFINDSSPKKLKTGKKSNAIVLDSWSDNEPKRILRLAISERKSPGFKKSRRKIQNKLATSISLAVGSGQLTYEYDDQDIGYPAWYEIDFTERILRISATYDLRHISAGIDFSYQGLNYYTSYLTKRLGEPYWNTNSEVPTLIENTAIETNRDLHTSSKTQFGLVLAGRITISKTAEIQPMFRYGIVRYKGQEYTPDRYEDVRLKLDNTEYFEPGLRIEFITGMFSTCYLEVSQLYHDWEPTGLLDEVSSANYDSRFRSLRFGVGFRKAIRF